MPFQPLFSITATHTYFADKTCRALHFKPTNATVKLMQQLGVLFKTVANGFSVFTDKQSPENSANEIILQFEVACSDDNFFKYTDLIEGKPGSLAYHTGNLSNVESDGITQLARLQNATANILTIALSDLTKKSKDKNECKFEINFNAKTTRWRYFLMNRTSTFHADLRIGNGKISFTEPDEVNLVNGEKALLFSSGDQLLPLSEFDHHHFSLTAIDPTGNLSEKSKLIIQALPEPRMQTDNVITGVYDAFNPISDIIIQI